MRPPSLPLLLLALLAGACAGGGAQAEVRPFVPIPEPVARRAPPSSAPPSAAAPSAAAASVPIPRPRPYAAALVAGQSVEGREIPVHVRGLGPDICLLLATIHGNEPAGTPILERLLAHLDDHPELLRGRRVIVMPVANPDGLAARTRANANGIDLNRNFEAPNRRDGGRYGEEALSEPEAAAVRAVVRQFRPSRVLSIHQPLRCVDWDGPARMLARDLAAVTDLPLKKLGTRPGSMGAWAEAGSLPLVTLELPPRVESLGADELWRRYGEAMLVFVRARP